MPPDKKASEEEMKATRDCGRQRPGRRDEQRRQRRAGGGGGTSERGEAPGIHLLNNLTHARAHTHAVIDRRQTR